MLVVITLVVVIGAELELDVVAGDDVVVGVEMVLATSIDGEVIAVVPIVIIKLLLIGSSDVIMIVLVGLNGTGTVLTFIISVMVKVNTSTRVISGLVISVVDNITAGMKSVCDTVVLSDGIMLVMVCAAVSN